MDDDDFVDAFTELLTKYAETKGLVDEQTISRIDDITDTLLDVIDLILFKE